MLCIHSSHIIEKNRKIDIICKKKKSFMKPDFAVEEGIKGILLPGRAIFGCAEGEMTRLDTICNKRCY
jgi:hypothetical protein